MLGLLNDMKTLCLMKCSNDWQLTYFGHKIDHTFPRVFLDVLCFSLDWKRWIWIKIHPMCDRIWEKVHCHAHFQNRVIGTLG